MIVRPAEPSSYPWLAKRAQLVIGSEFRMLEAVNGAGEIKAAVGFDGWTPNSVSVHLALDSPIALRPLLRHAFGIAFDQCKRELCLCTVLSSNKRSLALVRHLGFREAFRGVNYWDKGVDLVVFEMTRSACRWLGRNAGHPVSDNAKREAA